VLQLCVSAISDLALALASLAAKKKKNHRQKIAGELNRPWRPIFLEIRIKKGPNKCSGLSVWDMEDWVLDGLELALIAYLESRAYRKGIFRIYKTIFPISRFALRNRCRE